MLIKGRIMEFLESLFFSDYSNGIAIKNYFDQKQEKRNSFFLLGTYIEKLQKKGGAILWYDILLFNIMLILQRFCHHKKVGDF